jgi:ParB-like chromosome segregation protein Spo0J
MKRTNLEKYEGNLPTMISIDKIKPSRWREGIRDEEKLSYLRQQLKTNGFFDDAIHVFPLKEKGFYEVFIGDHRLIVYREFKWKEVPCIVEALSEQVAMERCGANNFTRADYDSVRAENFVTLMWKTNNYKSKQQLGDKLGLTGQRVGQLLKAKEIRENSKVTFDSSISTLSIIEASVLKNPDDVIALLELVKKKKISAYSVREHAKKLLEMSDKTRKAVLDGKISLHDALGSNTKSVVPKHTTTSKSTIQNPNFLPQLYESLNKLEDTFASIDDDQQKKEAINYVKFYTGIFLKILWKQGKISKEFFESVVSKELNIDRDMLHHFDGIRTKGMSWWLGDTSEESDEPTVEQAF